MYNPENLELPDFEDSSLTKYTWEYSVGTFTHVIAFDSEELEGVEDYDADNPTPEIEMDFETPFHYTADFHLMMWPEPSWGKDVPNLTLHLEELDPSHASYDQVRKELHSRLGVEPASLPSWRESATEQGYDSIAIVTWSDVRYEWKIRGLPGLTLEYLKSNLKDLEFSKGFSLPWDDGLLIDTFELPELVPFEALSYGDAELGSRTWLAKFQIEPSETNALEAARHLHEFGGPELASFHFPDLKLCRHCGELPHPEGFNCEGRLHTIDFTFN